MKLAIVCDSTGRSRTERLTAVVFKKAAAYYGSGAGADEFLDLEKPDFVLTDLKPVNGTEIEMSSLKRLDENIRLRVIILRKRELREFIPAMTSVIRKVQLFRFKGMPSAGRNK